MSYLKFHKMEDLVWWGTDLLSPNAAAVDRNFYQSKYPNAQVTTSKLDPLFRDSYAIVIRFLNEADEAEFILKENK